ncbi:MAG TPA: ATP-binding protein [Candidatus Binatia bacterium]|nr:ATP-binding protein [Candidatus Binatia bacterium]
MRLMVGLPGWARYLAALLSVGAVTAVIAALGRFHLANASMLYLVVVLLAAVVLGRGPAIVSAFAAFLASNFFLVEPRFTLAVANPEEWITLILLLLTAMITGQVAAGQKGRAEEAEEHARAARLQYEVALLMAEPSLSRAVESVAERVRGELAVPAVRIDVVGSDGVRRATASAGDMDALEALKLGIGGSDVLMPRSSDAGADAPSRWMRVRPPHSGRRGARPLRLLRVPIRSPHGDAGEIVLAAPLESELDPASIRLLEALSPQLWAAVERARLRDEATQAEVARRADQAKSALLDAVSHDLRTPLSSIIASAGSLLQSDIDWPHDERRGFAQAIEQEAQRLDRIVGNLLDLSRLESGELRPDRGWYEPIALIHDVVGRLRPLIGTHPIRLDLPEELPPVLLDYSKVDQVLSNLVENAAKYSPPGAGIAITAAVTDGTLQVTVTDDGTGIAPEALSHLFEPFFRGSRARPQSGSGLGLAVARGLVEAHRGRIWAENRPGGGASFTFDIPGNGTAQ